MQFVHYVYSFQERNLQRSVTLADASRQGNEFGKSTRILAAYLDLDAGYSISGPHQTAHTELRGFWVETQMNLSSSPDLSPSRTLVGTMFLKALS